jgi:hypothetical protein
MITKTYSADSNHWTNLMNPVATPPNMPRLVHSASTGEKQMGNEQNYMNTLDKQLRAAEVVLQQDDAIEKTLADAMPDATATVGNIDKIRDILFGGHMRDYDKRFKRLEDRYAQETSQLRDDLAQRIRVLEELLNSEVDSITEKAKSDRQERQSAQQELLYVVNSLKNELNVRINQLDEQFSRDVKQMRQQVHTKFQDLSLQLRQQNENLMGLVKQEVGQLQEDKVSRTDLASFFSEFALRLNKEPIKIEK